MNSDNLIKANNLLRKKLTSENQKYYEDLLTYIRGKSTFNREKDVEQLLLEILHDLIDAQNNGQNAEDYFGKNPQTLADEILQTLPKSFFETFKLACYILIGYVLLFATPNIVLPTSNLDFGKLIILGTISFVFSLVVLWLIGQETYQKNKLIKLASYVLGTITFAGIVIGSVFLKTPLAISLPGWYGIGTILVLLTITTMIYTAERKRLPFLIIVYIFIVIDSLLGIGTRIPGLSVFLNQPIPKSTALWVLVIGGPIVALICGFGSWWYLKKHEN
ncbi:MULTISPECIES: hypothetical protein [Lactobacillaceae]|jgi:DNA-binding ferritin-like protein (Dps family)|uniref:hypothetical protein n=1 Tax=Lactobacillaceae TaxID=33958 RepID=UPI0007E313B9|nr:MULTISPECIES: hypothetical protein [Lactobacillaceae]ANI96934.1 hypothetical protein A9F05_15345 [Lactiplantibacillus plantarum]AYG29440.1 hypothetical protein CFI62_16015 [Lactiplantibacillus plantarum]MBP5841238.1 hypothetical protein [Lactiplantibacillus plantarum]MBW4803497.1 hypothetical protein [Loigolactobacillus coryniformis subsp. torquens]MBW4806208.1 hypothetical protein [Loigolactobacillus coryniformis subsp. torquens]